MFYKFLNWLVFSAIFLSQAAFATKPQRIVSLNLCADQLLLQLAEPKRIASLTELSIDPELSYFSEKAKSYPINHGSSEEILQLNPDLILAGSFTARPAVTYLEKKGYRVVKLKIPESIEEMRRQFLKVAELLGESDKAELLLAEMDRSIINAKPDGEDNELVAAVYYANGFTAGKKSITTEVLNSAGFENLSERSGVDSFGFYPLEKLIEAKPDLLILGSYNKDRHSLAQKLLDHPALKRVWDKTEKKKKQARVVVPDNLWICATPMIAEVVDILAEQRNKIRHER